MSKKYAVWVCEDGYFEKNEEFESSVPKEHINFFKFCWYVLTNRSFRFGVEDVIKYALRHHECWRGYGASDVMLFKTTEEYLKIWKKRKLKGEQK